MLNTQSQSASIKEVDRPVVLSVEHVGKYFKLPTEQASGLKQAFCLLYTSDAADE